MKLYHATDSSNLNSVISKGLLLGPDGAIYFSDTPEHAMRFLAFQSLTNDQAAVVEVNLPKGEFEKSFDHSEKFFGCRAWLSYKPIPPEKFLSADLYLRGRLC